MRRVLEGRRNPPRRVTVTAGHRVTWLLRLLRLVVLASTGPWLVPGLASAQTLVVQPAPGPVMGPPVVVMPGQPRVVVPAPAASIVLGGVPSCPPEVPCPPPCPVGAVCPPPPCVCGGPISPPVVVPRATVVANGAVVATGPAPTHAVVDAAPSEPSPGTFGLGYLGTFDGTDVLHGGALRFTGHLVDVWFLDAVIGVQGASTSFRDIAEGVFVIGPRVAAPLVTPNLRVYGALDVGVLIRSIGNRNTWGIFSAQLGGGLELGVELDPNWAIGGYVDVRAEARVPFERESASLGVTWSGGLALLWF